MGTLDFLFEGSPPTAVTTYGTSTESLPAWLSDYTQGLIAKANAIAAEEYQPYEGARIADFTPEQLAAFEATQQNVGSYEPYLDQATQSTLSAGAVDPLASASPYITQASATLPGSIDEYINPYTQNVLERQAELSQRTLTEDFLPQLQDAFVGAGQYGSERMQDLAQQGVRDISENLESQRLATLADAYNVAGTQFATDQQRLADLGTTVGGLATAGGELGLQAGEQLGTLGQLQSQLGLQDAAALEAVGSQQQAMDQASLDLAYQDFQSQLQYPQEQIDWLSSVIRGTPYDTTTTTTETAPASVYQPSGISQLGALASALQGYQSLTS